MIMIVHERDHENSLMFFLYYCVLFCFFCYAKQTSKSFGQIDYIILLTN